MANEFANPFPGMNPGLESAPWWREIHNTLICEILSPGHKHTGRGRDDYQPKRNQILRESGLRN